MRSQYLSQLKTNLNQLSVHELLWLLEQLTTRLRELTVAPAAEPAKSGFASDVGQFSQAEELSLLLAEVRATPSNPAAIRPAKGSLAEALRAAPDDPEFDLGQWQRNWDVAEAEMKAITKENDLAEGFDR